MFGRLKKSRDGLAYSCRPCKRDYLQRHYVANKPAYLKKAKDWGRRTMAALAEAKSRPCADCGGIFPPYVMDFDHLPGEEKAFNVSQARNQGAAKVAAEIAKCDIVCANCHRIRTHKRRNP